MLYFHIRETEKKCFKEEIPGKTVVIGKYQMQLYDKQQKYQPATPRLGMFMEARTEKTRSLGPVSTALKAGSLSHHIPLATIRSIFTLIPPRSPFLLKAC